MADLSQLSQEDLAEVLRDAQRMDRGGVSADLEAFLQASEEAGVSRASVMAALQARLGTVTQVRPGNRVFARSSDRAFYVAEVLSQDGSTATVRFEQGSTATLPLDELRPFHLLPGAKITANWPGWGWSSTTIQSYDEDDEVVRLSDGFSTKEFKLTDIRLHESKPSSTQALIWKASLWSGTIGLIVGAILMRIFGG
jgi:hypothetical protein